jgi:hypothetical protein
MEKNRTNIIIVVQFIILSSVAVAEQLAFPGAEGFGRFATGGRGGSVYHVTNLNDSGPGSFRDAVSQSNRTVVFDVGGVINIAERVVVSSNVTIAGQTAPGDGIVIYGNGLSHTNAHNSITRFIRVRMGVGGDSGKDAMTIARGHDMIFDHISVSWGRDGTFDINYDSGYEIYNITIQDSIISQGLISHSTGGLIQSTGGVSLLRNLWIDNNTRNPKVKGINEYVNNVVYNWDVAAYILGDSTSDSYANILNNYFIYGPNSGADPFTRGNLNFHVYAADNYKDTDKDGVLDGSVIPQAEYGTVDWQTTPYAYPSLTPMDTTKAYYIVTSRAGSYMPRDQVDEQLIAELTSLGTLGELITTEYDSPMNGPGTLNGGTAPTDTDQDGMPDEWEEAVGSDPNAADNNGDDNGDGYTNLEEYLNWLAEPHAKVTRDSAVDIDLRQFASGFGTGANYSVSEPNHGTVTLLADDHTARFEPTKGYSGLAGFSYTVDNGYTMSERVNVLVTPLGEDWVYGDFTGNDVVEMNDVPYFLDFWLEDDCNTTAELDLDGNCLINFHEFSAVADNWLKPPPDTNAPAAPTLLRAKASNGTVSLDWADNSEPDVNGYNIYRSTTFGSGYARLNTTLLSSSDYTDTAVVNDTMYYYVVTAADTSANESVYSQYTCAVPSADGNSVMIQENTFGFCSVDGTVDNDNAGYTGAGFSNTDNAVGNGIDWRMNVVTGGTYTFTWRYANGGSGDRPARLLVNSSEVVSNISYPVTTDWTMWTTVSTEVALTAGTKDIRLEATGADGLANIDYIRVTGPNPEPAACP